MLHATNMLVEATKAARVLLGRAVLVLAFTACATRDGGAPAPREGRDASVSSAAAAATRAAAAPPTAAGDPRFPFVHGAPGDTFARDPDDEARWLQRQEGKGWGQYADVAAGPGDEWLIEVGTNALVVSQEAGGFWIRRSAWSSASNPIARALTRGAKKDVVLERWEPEGQPPNGYEHRVLEVWSFLAEGPVLRFALEVEALAMCCGSEANAPPNLSTDVTVTDDAITVRPRRPWRAGPQFSPAALPGVEPRVPPDVKERVYAWDGHAFAVRKETR